MIRVKISGTNFEDLKQLVASLSVPDFTPLAERVAAIMIEDNRSGLLAGLDCFGDEMTPVTESTIRRGRGGDGPPLIPRGEASRAISDYRVDIEDIPSGKRLTGSWPDTPFIRYHVTGTKHMPPRDPADIRPIGQEKLQEALDDFCSTLIGGRP
jgi:hypothetical protein